MAELSGTAALLLQHLYRDPVVMGAAVPESEPTPHIVELSGAAALLLQHLHRDPVVTGAAVPQSESTPRIVELSACSNVEIPEVCQ